MAGWFVLLLLQDGYCGEVCKMCVICLPTEHQGVHKNSFKHVHAFLDQININPYICNVRSETDAS